MKAELMTFDFEILALQITFWTAADVVSFKHRFSNYLRSLLVDCFDNQYELLK